jgi:hypothetical protein
MNPTLKTLYDLIDERPEDIRKAVWNEIDQITREWIQRRDYVDDETFKFVVKPPYTVVQIR